MRIYFMAVDHGDGSLGVAFYESKKCIELLEKHDPECYRGEGGGCMVFDGLDVPNGITVQTLEEVQEEIKEAS